MAQFEPDGGSAIDTPKKERISMPMKVLIGGLLGIATGVFFGEKAMFLEPIGRAYVLLIQAVVYPYIIASLIHGMGSMPTATAGRLFRRGFPVYLVLWGLTFCVLVILSVGIPEAVQLVFFPPHGEIASIDTLLDLLIPSDPFEALSENHMPAIVIFCLIFGAAFQRVERKSELLAMLEAVRRASLQFWVWIALLVPYAVFALFAVSAGTVSVQALPQLAIYLGLVTLGCLMLALWILPMLLSAIAPVTYREILGDLKEALTIAIATSVTAAAIPYVIELTRKLADRTGVADEQRDDVIATNVSIGYAIGTIGTLFLYLFVLFAAAYFGNVIGLFDSLALPLVSLLSSVGSTVAALEFICNWLDLPPEAVQLYIETSTLGGYPKIVLSIIALSFISVAVTLNYYGKLKIRLGRVFTSIAVPMLIIGAAAWGMGWLDRTFDAGKTVTPYADLGLAPADIRGVKATFQTDATADPQARVADSDGDTFQNVLDTGVLRVGVNENAIPFTYRNSRGELVGYDIAFAYELARALGVDLVFVPFEWGHLTEGLTTGRFDIAAAGLYETDKRMRDLIASDAYFTSEPALFGRPNIISSLVDVEAIVGTQGLKLAAFDRDILLASIDRRLDNLDIAVVPSYGNLPDFTSVDAAIWSLAQAKALAVMNDNIAVVVPANLGEPFVLVYYLPPKSRRLRIFANDLIRDLKNLGWHDRQVEYWINGRGNFAPKERWSIYSDVLGWDRN